MMNRFQRLPLLTLLMLVLILTLLFSWIGSVYGLPLQNLLAPEGIRWLLRSAVDNFGNTPVLSILIALIGVGILGQSGWLKACAQLLRLNGKRLSPKQRWALRLSLFVAAGYAVLMIWGLLAPHAILLSVTGEVSNSPFTEGFIAWFVFGISLVSGIYGWISGCFRTHTDVIKALSRSVSDCADAFVVLFVSSQWVAYLHYAGFIRWWNMSESLCAVLTFLLYILPFLFDFWLSTRKEKGAGTPTPLLF